MVRLKSNNTLSISPFVAALNNFTSRNTRLQTVALLFIMIQKIYDFTFISEIKQAKIKQILAFRIIRVFSFRDYSIYIYIYIDPILVYLISIKASKIE